MRIEQERFYISEHRLYYTPSEWRVQWELERRKLGSNTFLAQELARFYYHRMVESKDYVDEYFQDESLLKDEEKQTALKSAAFYEKIWDKYVPGLSPLEKALNLLALLKKEQEAKGGRGNQGAQGKEGKGEGISREDMLDSDVERALKRIPEKEIFESHTLNVLFDRKEGLNDFHRKVELLNKIAMVERFGKTFDVKKTVAEKRVHNSRIHKHKRLVEYSELINSPIYQRVLPHYSAKLLTKNVVVNTPVVYEESKQKIIMLVDYSGSMNNGEKQNWVLSILADRLRYCVLEECEIFFSFFLTLNDLVRGNFKFTHIYNKETALEFFRTVSTAPSGGDTEVGLVVDRIREEIMKNKRLFNLNIDLSHEKPEILVINDGQDTVKADQLTWKTNAITLYGHNEELERLCNRTGGKFITVTSKMDGTHTSY